MSNLILKEIEASDISDYYLPFINKKRAELESYIGFIPDTDDLHRQTINDPDYEPDLHLAVHVDNEIAGVILGIRRPWKQEREKSGFIKWLFIDPDIQSQEIGSTLLSEIETRLEDKHVDKLIFGSSSPTYIYPGVPANEQHLCDLLKDDGWTECSKRISLSIDLKEIEITPDDLKPPQSTELSLSLFIATPEDKTRLMNFIEKEFSSSWALEIETSFSNAQLPFCSALSDNNTGKILGFAAVNTMNPNWFGPMGVSSELRGLGLGKLLFRHAIVNAQKRGNTKLILSWVNDKEAFYRKLVPTATRLDFFKFEKLVRQ